MKKKFLFGLIAFLMLATVFVSCGDDDDEPEPSNNPQNTEKPNDNSGNNNSGTGDNSGTGETSKEFTVLYTAENNVGALGGASEPEQKVKDGATVKIAGPGTLAATGYNFIGWSTTKGSSTAEYTEGQEVKVTANLILYSVWEKQATPVKTYDYKVIYDLNGGSGTTPEAVELTRDFESLTLATSTATKDGKKFIGWAASKTATNAEYAGGQKLVKNGTDAERLGYSTFVLKVLTPAILQGGEATIYAVYETATAPEPETPKTGYLWIVHDSSKEYEFYINNVKKATWTKAGTYKYELEVGTYTIEVKQISGYLLTPTTGKKTVTIKEGKITELSGPKSSTSSEYFN